MGAFSGNLIGTVKTEGTLQEAVALVAHLSNSISLIGSLSFPEGYEEYKGEYIFTPTTEPQTIDTNDRLMIDDIIIDKIPYSEVTNVSNGTTGGKTVTIG